MSVSLTKGQRVDLTKGRPSLKKVLIGLGWDVNQYDGEADFDLDASVFMTKENGKVGSDDDFIFYLFLHSCQAADIIENTVLLICGTGTYYKQEFTAFAFQNFGDLRIPLRLYCCAFFT